MGQKHIIFIHGRHYKPARDILKKNYLDAVRHGLERDFGKAAVSKFNKAKTTLSYYGDISNDFLVKHDGKPYTAGDMKRDVEDRRNVLTMLKRYKSNEFTKAKYNNVKTTFTPLKEAFADLLSGPLSLLGIGDELVSTFAPDMGQYWKPDTAFGSEVRWRLTEDIVPAIKRGDQILLIAHSLGTLISYDVLWKLSHYGEYKYLREGRDKLVDTLITLGSPLGDENVKGKLKGAANSDIRRYPTVLSHWHNFAAEDDYISHDETIANDFADMKKLKLVNTMKDNRVYNMSVRDGEPNPHHCTGYLVTPKVCKTINDWL